MKTSSNADVGLPIYSKVAAAGLAGMTADLCTYPLDTIKVWLMVRKNGGDSIEAAVSSPKSPPVPKMITNRTKSMITPTTKLRKVIKVIKRGSLAQSSLTSSVRPIVKKLIPIEKTRKRIVLKTELQRKSL